MKTVHFASGPFPKYADGHPPEKETEEERRRYRKGLTLPHPKNRSVWDTIAHNAGADFGMSWFERRRHPTPDRIDVSTSPSLGAKDGRLGSPLIWQSIQTPAEPQKIGMKDTEGLHVTGLLSLLSGPPQLCRDSVTSIDDSYIPKTPNTHKEELEKELCALEYEEIDLEAMWSSSSDSWDAGEVKSGLSVNEREIPTGNTPGCFNALLGALRWDRWPLIASRKKRAVVESILSSLPYSGEHRSVAEHCSRGVKKMFGDLCMACGIALTSSA